MLGSDGEKDETAGVEAVQSFAPVPQAEDRERRSEGVRAEQRDVSRQGRGSRRSSPSVGEPIAEELRGDSCLQLRRACPEERARDRWRPKLAGQEGGFANPFACS